MLYVIGNGLLLVLVWAELLFKKLVENQSTDIKDLVFNVNSGHIMLWVIRSVELASYHLILQHLSLHILDDLHPIVMWVFATVAWDLSFYWYHRIHHKYRWLWYIHVVHHEGEEFNLSLGMRNSWYSALTTIPFFAWMAVLGVPFHIFLVVSLVHYFIQFLNHNSIISEIGVLGNVMVSPSHHKVHHGKQEVYTNTNFGGTFVWWDHLFGTYQAEVEDQPVVVGVASPTKSYNVFHANNIKFLRDFGIALSAAKSPKFEMPNWLLLVLTSLTFCGFLVYVNFEEILLLGDKLNLFAVVFLAITAIGGLSEGQRWAVLLWVANAAFFLLVVSPLIEHRVSLAQLMILTIPATVAVVVYSYFGDRRLQPR